MRIGEFSKKYNVSVDTIRYYIASTLLTPQKKYNQYIFDNECEEEMKEILELRDLKFTISEIKKFITFRRTDDFFDDLLIETYKEFFYSKKQDLLLEKRKIEKALGIIDQKEKQLSVITKIEQTKLGIPFNFIKNLECNKCKNELSLNAKNIEKNNIFFGELYCECGVLYEIKNGILFFDGASEEKLPDDLLEMDTNYEQNSTPHIIAMANKAMKSISNKISEYTSKDKIIYEASGDFGCYFSVFNKNFTDYKYYIINQLNYNLILKVKEHFEKIGTESGKVIFICGDPEFLPIKDYSVNFIVDNLFTLNYGIETNKLFLSNIKNKLQSNSIVLGIFPSYEEYSKTLKTFQMNQRIFLSKDLISEKINEFNYDKVIWEELGKTDNPGHHAPIHKENEYIHFYNYYLYKK